MADKAISELVAANAVTPDSLFVLQQDGTAKKLEAQTLENWLLELAEGHGGIVRYEMISQRGLVKTYRFTLADQAYMDISVSDGRGVTNISKVSTSGLVDTYRITYNDGSTGTFTVTNGAKGDPGAATYTWIKYASQKPTASSNSFGDIPDAWLGIYVGPMDSAPTDWQAYSWFKWKGDQGDTGAPATVTNAQVSYLASDSGTVIPSGSWSTTVPLVTPGRYLWTRTVLQFNSGSPVTTHSVSRFGIDGAGAVSTVCGVAPDTNGNVPLTAALLGAVATVAGIAPDENGNVPITAEILDAMSNIGGMMYGSINMNGHSIDNLPDPEWPDQAIPRRYADTAFDYFNETITDLDDWTQESFDYMGNYIDYKVPPTTEEDSRKILSVNAEGHPEWIEIAVWAAGSY